MCIYRELLPRLIGHPSIYRPILALLLAIGRTHSIPPLFNTLDPPYIFSLTLVGRIKPLLNNPRSREKRDNWFRSFIWEWRQTRFSLLKAWSEQSCFRVQPHRPERLTIHIPQLPTSIIHIFMRHRPITRLLRKYSGRIPNISGQRRSSIFFLTSLMAITFITIRGLGSWAESIWITKGIIRKTVPSRI